MFTSTIVKTKQGEPAALGLVQACAKALNISFANKSEPEQAAIIAGAITAWKNAMGNRAVFQQRGAEQHAFEAYVKNSLAGLCQAVIAKLDPMFLNAIAQGAPSDATQTAVAAALQKIFPGGINVEGLQQALSGDPVHAGYVLQACQAALDQLPRQQVGQAGEVTQKIMANLPQFLQTLFPKLELGRSLYGVFGPQMLGGGDTSSGSEGDGSATSEEVTAADEKSPLLAETELGEAQPRQPRQRCPSCGCCGALCGCLGTIARATTGTTKRSALGMLITALTWVGAAVGGVARGINYRAIAMNVEKHGSIGAKVPTFGQVLAERGTDMLFKGVEISAEGDVKMAIKDWIIAIHALILSLLLLFLIMTMVRRCKGPATGRYNFES